MRFSLVLAAIAFASLGARAAHAEGRPNGASYVRLLGNHAALAFASPKNPTIGALVAIPPGLTAEALGLEPVVAGYGRLRGEASILAFASAHPDIPVSVAPPLHMLMDKAGDFIGATTAHTLVHGTGVSDGSGVLIGVADTGLDCTHPDMRDAAGHSRVAWILDLSLEPLGLYPDLEARYGVYDKGTLVAGAVLQGTDIDRLNIANKAAPADQVGHGTHVTSIAAGNGGIKPHTLYVGVAPSAKIIFARVTRDATDSIDNDDLTRGVQFLFETADKMGLPISVNISLGSDFGPHDGTEDWEKVVASFVGPDHPGHAVVAAAGNSGSIFETPIHQSVHVSPGATVKVPIVTQGAQNGALDVWVATRAGQSIKMGLVGPDGEWIAPVAPGNEAGKNPGNGAYHAAVINGTGLPGSPIPADSHGGAIVWSGKWPAGTYYVTLQGDGLVDMYLQGSGDVVLGPSTGFLDAARESTVNLPATHPNVIAAGCTVNRTQWTSIDKVIESQLVPVVDPTGGRWLPDPAHPSFPQTRELSDGEMCWFSSAGPTLTGVPKPEIAAPGGLVVAAMSKDAAPGSANSIFTTQCPAKDGQDGGTRCLQIDKFHGVSQGTSMSAPLVAGAIALLLQRDPTLTQDEIIGLLQAGAHPFRGSAPFDDQSGPGELDILGAIDALEETSDMSLRVPSADKSWLTLSQSYAPSDGSMPVTAVIELRTSDGQHRADRFASNRLVPYLAVDGVAVDPPPILVRHAPGVWAFQGAAPSGTGGGSITFGAQFDGADVVAAKTIPIGADVWQASYATTVSGGCALSPTSRERSRGPGGDSVAAIACAALVLLARARVRQSRRA